MQSPTPPSLSTHREQYDAISARYTALVQSDPVKQYVQYPSALRLLGNVDGLSILDVGCGNGTFDLALLQRGAQVTGYDNSAEQIAAAKRDVQTRYPHATFLVSSPLDFTSTVMFDRAVSVLVLHYAEDTPYLTKFFESTARALKPEGSFVAILVNPTFKRIGEAHYNRRFHVIGDTQMSADFLDADLQVSFTAVFSRFSREAYEHAAQQAGFVRWAWVPLTVEKAGVDAMGEAYWEGFEEDCPYIGFVANTA